MVLLHIALGLSIGLSVCQRYQRKKNSKISQENIDQFPVQIRVCVYFLLSSYRNETENVNLAFRKNHVIATSALVICFYNFVEL